MVFAIQHSLMMDHDPLVVSKQLWALLALITKISDDMTLIFKNVRRHNGAEAYRRLVEPILASTQERRADYQKKTLAPRKAAKINDVIRCMEEWEIDQRLFLENGGIEASDESR